MKRVYSGNKYYLIYPKSLESDVSIQVFQSWLLAQRDRPEESPAKPVS